MSLQFPTFALRGRSLINFVLTVTLVGPAMGQNLIGDVLSGSVRDIAAVKQNAEAGNADSQVVLGNVLAAHFRQAEALEWYRKAANQGSVDAEFRVGQMLLFGAWGDSTNAVHANPVEGLRWTFMAATNLNPSACYNMSKALRQGLGTSVDPVAAYAWLVLLSELPSSAFLGRLEMNDMALKMSTADMQKARILAVQFKAGNWAMPMTRIVPEGDPRIRLTGVAFAGKNTMAVINGKVLSEGDSTTIALKPENIRVRCLKIFKDSVLILIEGERQPRILHLSH